MAETSIASAYVQILPTTKGIASGIAEALGSGTVAGAAASAGGEIAGGIAGALGAGGIAGALGVGAAVAGMTALGKEAVQTGMQFDAAMSQVYSMMSNTNDGAGLTAAEMETLRTRAREMGATTQFTAAQVADAMGFMALAGWKVDEVYKGIPSVLGLAAASSMDLGQASDIVTDYMSAFSKTAPEAQQLVDVLAYAQANSNSTTFQFASAWQYAAANMNLAGQSAETVTAMLAYMANSGHKASTAGTEMNAMFTSLTKAMDRNGTITINKQNVALQDNEGHWRNFIDIIGDVQAAMSSLDPDSPQYVAELMSTFGNVRSMRAIATLLNGDTQAMREFETELKNAGGTAEKQAEIVNDNLAGDLKLLNSAIDDLKISISDSITPLLRTLVQTITPFFNWLSKIVQTDTNPFKGMAEGLEEASAEDWEGTGRRISELLAIIRESPAGSDASVGALGELNTLRATIANLDMGGEGENVVQGIAKGMTGYEFGGDADQVAGGIIAAMDDALLAHSPARAMVPTGENAAAGIGLGMIAYDYAPDSGTAADALKRAISAAVGAENWQGIGAVPPSGIGRGVTNNKNQAVTPMKSVIDAMKAKARTEIGQDGSKFKSFGTDIAKGIAQGVTDGESGLEEAINKIIDDALEAAREHAGVNSPSTLFAEGLGRWIPMGVAEGVSRYAGDAVDAVDDMTGALLSGNAALLSTTNGAAARGGFVQNVTINSPRALSPLEVARQTRNATRRFVEGIS